MLMATGKSMFINQAHTQPLASNGMALGYLRSTGHGGARFASTSVCPSGVRFSGTLIDVGSLVARIGMAPSGFKMPEQGLGAVGYGATDAVPTRIPVAPQPSNGKPVPYKASWTQEEDSILRDMVQKYGERKWALIAAYLPNRISKQCRERWINHLRPDIKKEIWTEDDDRALIGLHEHYGNRWSVIAKYLSGRSENSVKNHWNATKRSLKAIRRIKKKTEQSTEFTALERYMLSKNLHNAKPTALPRMRRVPQEPPEPLPTRPAYGMHQQQAPAPTAALPVYMPPHNIVYNSRVVDLAVPPAVGSSKPSEMVMNSKDANLNSSDPKKPLLPDLNISIYPEEHQGPSYPN